MRWNQKYTKDEMALAIELYKASGLSQKGYAEQEGINVHTFKSWIVKQNKTSQKVQKETSKFLSVKMQQEYVQPSASTDTKIEIDYPNGLRITCPSTLSAEQLKALINF